MSTYAALIPVNVLTGFLGSGKTTLLQRLLRAPVLSSTAVLVNEFGDVGLDHHLLEAVTDNTLLLDNGCLCCAIRDDLRTALRDLFSARERGEIPKFDRVIIETSGLADPVPIGYTLATDPVIQHHFRIGAITTVVDALIGQQQLQSYPEALQQVGVADRLLLSKTDLVDEPTINAMRTRLRSINAAASIGLVDDASAEQLLVHDIYEQEGKKNEVRTWYDASGYEATGYEASGAAHGAVGIHTDAVTSFSVIYAAPINWTAFGIWLSMLLHRHGERILRVKGIVAVAGQSGPVLINAVQHIVHPPTHLDKWPTADHSSRIVFIVRDLPQAALEASLKTFAEL